MLQKALEFLRKHNEITFATTDGTSPHLRIFQIMRQEGTTLYFATSAKKAVWQELQENPNVELLAYADKISVRCSGMVNFYVSDDIKRWIYDNNPVLPRLYASYDHLEYFYLPIAELDYFDLNPTPPINQHFDLMTGEVDEGFVGERIRK
ncbi:MAG: pyridoxamine 5'-phosphate oxidase family protein [Prevotella sp.]|nr:pyridoxamine 5'-phosphate oxidase family protein [Prevotella sp.]